MDTTGIEGLWIEIQLHVHLWDFYAALTLISPTYWRVQKYLLHIAYIVVSEDIDFIDVENSNPLDCLIKIHYPSNRQRVYETIKLLDTLVCDLCAWVYTLCIPWTILRWTTTRPFVENAMEHEIQCSKLPEIHGFIIHTSGLTTHQSKRETRNQNVYYGEWEKSTSLSSEYSSAREEYSPARENSRHRAYSSEGKWGIRRRVIKGEYVRQMRKTKEYGRENEENEENGIFL